MHGHAGVHGDMSGRLIAAREQERARIGRELHDNVSQRLALLSIEIDALSKVLPGGRGSEIAASVARLRLTCREVANDVHVLSHQFHGVTLQARGLVRAVQDHCRELSRRIKVQCSDTNVPPALPDAAALCLFRVVQEALANVVKHSGAAAARVMLSGGKGEVVVRVEDGGRGFRLDTQRDGLGLLSMRERVHSLGGDIDVRSTPNHGTVIEARVPVRASAQDQRDLEGARGHHASRTQKEVAKDGDGKTPLDRRGRR
jgi:signal transduction histidine kinase